MRHGKPTLRVIVQPGGETSEASSMDFSVDC